MIKNVIALAIIQGGNAILPLVLFPIALAVLGSEKYAQLVFTEAQSLIVVAVVIYGLDVIAVREVRDALAGGGERTVARSLGAVLFTRLTLFLLGSGLALLACTAYERELLPILAGWLLVPLSHAVQPTWYFNAVERNSRLGFLTAASRIGGATVAILILHRGGGPALVAWSVGVSYLVSAIVALVHAFDMGGGVLHPARAIADIPDYLRRGRYMFLSNLSVVLYRDLNVLILGLLAVPPTAVAVFSIADKLSKTIQAIVRPISQHYFPMIIETAAIAKRPSSRLLHVLMRFLVPQMLFLGFVWVGFFGVLFVDARTGIINLSSISNLNAIWGMLVLMVPGSFFGVANFVLGAVALNGLGADRLFLRLTLLLGVSGPVVGFGLVWLFGAHGAAVSVSLAEFLLAALVLRCYVVGCSEDV